MPRLKALHCISASSWGPSKKSLSPCIKLFFGPFSLMFLLMVSFSQCYPISPNWNAFTERLVALPLAASRPSLSHFSLRGLYNKYLVTLTHFPLSSYERVLRLPTSFPTSGLARLAVKPRFCSRSSWRVFAFTHLLMLPFSSHKEGLFVCPPSPPRSLPSFHCGVHPFLFMLPL